MNSSFLEKISWTEARFEFQAVDRIELPPYAGSTLRGALGHVLRPALCGLGGQCGSSCVQPDQCGYYSLFERSRNKDGANLPKPMILIPPRLEELESIAMGGPVVFPYTARRPGPRNKAPVLANEHDLIAEPGAVVEMSLRLIGPTRVAMPGIVTGLARYGLTTPGGRLRLKHVSDGDIVIWDASFGEIPVQRGRERKLDLQEERVQQLRIVLATPAIFKLDDRVCFDLDVLAERFFDHCLARAVQIYNAFFAGLDRMPWVDLPECRWRVVGTQGFQYELRRRSLRQDRWMNFDGLVGYADFAGELGPLMPYVRAAEVLHFGQKATFGLGKVRALVLA